MKLVFDMRDEYFVNKILNVAKREVLNFSPQGMSHFYFKNAGSAAVAEEWFRQFAKLVNISHDGAYTVVSADIGPMLLDMGKKGLPELQTEYLLHRLKELNGWMSVVEKDGKNVIAIDCTAAEDSYDELIDLFKNAQKAEILPQGAIGYSYQDRAIIIDDVPILRQLSNLGIEKAAHALGKGYKKAVADATTQIGEAAYGTPGQKVFGGISETLGLVDAAKLRARGHQ